MDQIFKMLELLMNMAFNKTQNASKQLVLTARKLVIVALIALASAALFCVGVSMVVINLAQKIENPIMVGSILAVVALLILIFNLNQKNWLKTASMKDESNIPKGPSPIEQALALLITDIVAERQLKRTAEQKPSDPL